MSTSDGSIQLARLARQPIFDRAKHVAAYELLYRGPFGIVDGTAASATVLMNAFAEIGLDQVTGTKRGFINITPSLLVSDLLTCLPPDKVVLEVLETCPATQDNIDAVRRLHKQGYTIALDDYAFQPELEAFLPLVQIIKLDIVEVAAAGAMDQVKTLVNGKRKLLAEKVEDKEQMDAYQRAGCELFQGYYFMKPEIVEGRAPAPFRVALLSVIARLRDPSIGLDEVARLISADATLSYRLVRFLRSAFVGGPQTVDSVRGAVMFLGIKKAADIATLILLSGAGEKSSYLLTTALVRAHMGEALSRSTGCADPDQVYTAGLFSVLDALFDMPMEQCLTDLPLPDMVKEALVDPTADNPVAAVLRATLEYERGEWTQEDEATCRLDAHLFRKALRESEKLQALIAA